MIKVAICEDEPNVGLELQKIIENYARRTKTLIKIFHYQNAEDLEEFFLESPHCFDIIFFDILMSGMDGMTCARRIRQQSRAVKFVFVTNCRDYVFEGYEVNASRYILKPLDEAKIIETLDHVLREISEIRSKTIDVRSHGKIHRVSLEEIVLIEIDNNAIILTLANNKSTITLYEKLDDFLAKVNYNFFIRVHKSYAVNFLYIETYKTDKIILKNNVTLSISRNYKSKVRDNFFQLLHCAE